MLGNTMTKKTHQPRAMVFCNRGGDSLPDVPVSLYCPRCTEMSPVLIPTKRRASFDGLSGFGFEEGSFNVKGNLMR